MELKFIQWGLKIDQITLHQENNTAWREVADFLQGLLESDLQELDQYAKENLTLHANVLRSRAWFFAVFSSLFAFSEVLYGTGLAELMPGWLFLTYLIIYFPYFILLIFTMLIRQHVLELTSLVRIEMARRGIFTSDA